MVVKFLRDLIKEPKVANPINSEDAPRLVAEAAKSEKLRILRHDYSKRLAGKRCLIVGSAPNAVKLDEKNYDVVICVNGSGWTVGEWELGSPNFTVIGSRSLKPNTEVTKATARALRGAHTQELLLVEAGVAQTVALDHLKKLNFKFEKLNIVSRVEQAAIFNAAWDVEISIGPNVATDQRPSNGLFAVAVAIWGGATEVILTGFSVGEGHAYMDAATPRQHIDGDVALLKNASKIECVVKTTSAELAAAGCIGFVER